MMVGVASIVLYTLYLSGLVTSTDLVGVGELAASRHLLATDDASDDTNIGTVYYNPNCSLLYTRGVEIIFIKSPTKRERIDTLPGVNTSFSLKGSKCVSQKGEQYSILNVNYPDLKNGTVTAFSMKMTFNTTGSGEWYLQEMLVSVTCKASGSNCTTVKDQKMTAKFLKSRLGFSYHCTQPPMITAANSSMGINFNKLQVQPLGVKQKRFSQADDCVGFFSAGVWSCLFVILILVVILLHGIYMISGINVMDRFDDPKGPGIQVNVNE